MIRLQSRDGIWFELGPEYAPVSIFDFERDLDTVRNENEADTHLVGDELVRPTWIEFQARKAFPDASSLKAHIAALNAKLNNLVKLDYEGTNVYLNFGFCFVESRESHLDALITVRLAPVLTRFDVSGSPITWGSVDMLLGQTDVQLGD